ncbi:hypothetical protein COOONC_13253, partial [Cooperia oncophora]
MSASPKAIFYRHPLFLKFLRGVSKEGRIQYNAIIRGENLTYAQEQEKIAAWAKKYNRTEQVKKFKAEEDKKMEALKQKITAVFKSIPSTFQEYVKNIESEKK